MTDPGDSAERLAAGHPARRPVTRAIRLSVAAGAVFTIFAYVTTQVHAVRAASPWQDDPYDGMVSFTELLVPALILVIVLRQVLVDRHRAQPLFRVAQLLRAAAVCAGLVAATMLVDWTAVLLRADHQLWDDRTPWLVAALAPLTLLAAAALAVAEHARRRLPAGAGRAGGDWLDDLALLLVMAARRLPPGGRRAVHRLATGPALGLLRRHVVAVAATVSLLLSVGTAAAQAVLEGWESPLLLVIVVAAGFGGFFAFGLIADAALGITVRRREQVPPPPAVRRATRAALIAGSLALPACAVFRDVIWFVITGARTVHSITVFAAIVAAGGGVVTLVSFGAALAVVLSRRPKTA